MIQAAIKKYLGVPYKLRGRDLSGLDCYGLLILAYKDIGIEIMDLEEEYTEDWSWRGKNLFIENYHKDWNEVHESHPYDLVVFRNLDGIPNHAGIMIDGDKFLHTCLAGTVISRISQGGFKERFVGFVRHKSLC